MKIKERQEFLEWHKQKRKENYLFDLKIVVFRRPL
jgi:hypothetical protein